MRIRSWVHRTTAMASQPHAYPSVAVEMQQFSSASVAPSAATQIAKDSVELIFREVGYQVQVATTATKKCACAPPYSEDRQTKKILKGVTGIIRPQRITCILGASGAGKTSLLNILSGSLVSGSLSGQLLINGNPVGGDFIRNMSGYVHQDDVMMATQTVNEALTFAAALKMNFSSQERAQKVNEMLALLGLSGSENTVIGDSSMKGVSGGERKRVAVGMQLITNPSLLFLDEPTSGLDTLNAFNVVATLKKLALNGKTVVATLHQPSSEIFHMIDDLIVMAAGEIIYCGPAAAAVSYFSTLGFKCPMYSNPADFIFMDVLNLTKQAEIAMNEARKEDSAHEVASQQLQLSKQWSSSAQNRDILDQCSKATVKPICDISTNFHSGFLTQFSVLMQRAWKNALRNPLLVKAKVGQALFMGILLGLIYHGDAMKTHQAGIQNRTGVLFFMSINQVMSAAIGILSIFFAEKLVFMRENASGMYGMTAYFTSKVIVELPFSIITPFLFALVSYFFVGLDQDGTKFIIFAALCVLSSNCGVSIGMASTCLVSNLPTALAIAPLFLLPLMLFGGGFVNNGLIPVYLDWLKYISPIKYSYHAAMQNELTGLQFYCRDFEYTRVNGQISCARTNGDDVLKLMELKDLTIGENIAALFGLWMGFLLLSYLALRKTSTSPAGHSRFPKTEHFVPSQVAAIAVPSTPSSVAPAPIVPIPSLAVLSQHPELSPPNLFLTASLHTPTQP